MRILTVDLPDDVGAKLDEIARRERRRPRDQAVVMLVEAIASDRTASRSMNDAIRRQAGRMPNEPAR